MRLATAPRLALLTLAVAARAAWAQGAPARVSVRADNDAFNFWQAPWNRTDEEYTSGVRLVLDYGRRSVALGQDIYTAARHRDQPLAPGARPDAGVLWLSVGDHATHGSREVERHLIVGVTGAPALAAPMQRFFHGIAPGWNKPIDWSRQLPAEPVAGASYDATWHGAWRSVSAMPHAGASLGTLLTEARGGVGGAWAVHSRLELVGDVTGRLVGRSEVLSGTFFRGSDRVALHPVVGEWQAGVRGRIKRLSLAWIAHQTSAEYAGRRGAHQWSTLQVDWRRD